MAQLFTSSQPIGGRRAFHYNNWLDGYFVQARWLTQWQVSGLTYSHLAQTLL